ncbi:MAG: glycosyltransferase family 4 protein [Halobacteriovoraceae bacterium]|nr:glycosyltransferase family 4 protein [Halobacteriovoraceae bacterium]
MKILIVTQYFWPENFRINDLCEALQERGHEVTIYTGIPNYPIGKFFKGYGFFGPYRENFEGMRVIRVPMLPRGPKKGLFLALNYLSFFLSASFLAPFLLRGNFDRIFVYEPSPITVAIPGIVIKYLKKIPMVLWVTDLWPESLEATGAVKNPRILNLVGKMVKWIYRHTDKILITSKGFKKKVEAYCDDPEKISYWPQWAENLFSDSGSIPANYKDQNFPDSGFNLVFAGNIGSAQDFETIVGASEKLKDHKDIHFVILGDGMMSPWVEKEVQKRGLEETFFQLGRKPLETMPYYFKRADALLLTLRNSEIFSITIPSKLQSYLASGKPIVVGIDGEAAEIVNEWKAGVSSKAGDSDSLKDAILKLYNSNPDEKKEYGENAYECYEKEFHREKLVGNLEEIFRGFQ